nr:HutD-family protein [Rhizobium sp. Q54]
MQVLRTADYRRMPWKNGGGETVEIAVHPPTAGLEGFDWRVSMATVASGGPFSSFPGIDRTLCVLTGAGLRLDIEGSGPVLLDAQSNPCSFPADVATSASLIEGTITDLNVMTRRGVFTHTVERLVGPCSVPLKDDVRMLLCRTGRLKISTGGDILVLHPLDALLAEAGDVLHTAEGADFFLVRIRKVDPHFV